ncbi:MAG: ChaN family lipoprotein [Burkholderiaceae bacterium]
MRRSLLRHTLAWVSGAICIGLLQACATSQPSISSRIDALLPADIILFGEQHDAPQHHVLERALVLGLTRRGQLAALALEMAEKGRSTATLARDASETAVQTALQWDASGWNWSDYGPVVMAAVRGGVPVLGANLPRADMRAAMVEATLDNQLGADSLAQQRDNIRSGHCFLLPESQIAPMTRIQIARDAAMAKTLVAAVRPGKTVLLVAGGGHVLRNLGVPQHLPSTLHTKVVLAVAGEAASGTAASVDAVWSTPPVPPVDHCAELRKSMTR